MIFLEILTNYILPIIYDSFITLILVLLFLFIFRIKDSNIRILFFFLPLIKPFIVIAEKIDVNKPYLQSKSATGYFRLPDPNNIFKVPDRSPAVLFNINYLIILLIIIIIFLILIIRWVTLFLFYRNLAYEDKVGRKEVPEIYNIIDDYIKKIKIKAPDVSLTHRDYFSPFVVGIKNCTIVLSPNLIEKLNRDEKETLIQHELSHIKRKDSLISWAALILRDLLFFNPFVHIAYYLIKTEQEKDSDKLVVKYSQKPSKEISKNILNIILKIRSISTSKPIYESAQSFTFLPLSLFNRIKLKNRIKSIFKTDPAKIYSSIFPKILMYILFLVTLYIQLLFIIKIGDLLIFLR